MNKRNNVSMLREKRKHANYKPNRRLDAKSSRGMIYENEELRIRTININAEVEKGQSEIKSLKREREQLRREIWTLRDEYDKLENLLRNKGIDPDDFLNQKPNNHGDDEEGDENDLSDCSECSCEECCGEDENQSGEKSDETSSDQGKNEAGAASTSKVDSQTNANSSKISADEHNKRAGKDRLNLNFDHLSIVSEENSEGNSIILQNEDSCSIPIHDLSAFLHNVDVLSPLSLNYLQKLNPPLSHFENLNYEQIGGSNVDQHGNILANIVETNIVQQTPVTQLVMKSSSKPSNGSSTSTSRNNVVLATTNNEPVKKESRLKHFFSPIRKKSIVAQNQPAISQPDVFISNILPSNMYVNPNMHVQNSVPEISSNSSKNVAETSSPTSSFQTGGNLEELLFDIEALSKDIMNLQTQCTNSPTDNEPLNSKKPFRSELNLVLSYPGNSDAQSSPSSSEVNSQITPPLPTPMELLNPLTSHTNPLYLQNLPSPFPSPIPTSPLTPPIHFKTQEGVPDYSGLNFSPLPIFASDNSIFCTVSAPSTPASDRKCIDKFCVNENSVEAPRVADKKKSKRVSIVNTSKDELNEKTLETPEIINNDTKEGEGKEKKTDGNTVNGNNPTHHGHRHSHAHIHPKRRMSLDNTVNSARHKNHRQICQDPNAKVNRRESNRSTNSFKKRSRSDSAFGIHDDPGGTSVSERYSNSLASSRESSTSLSSKSKRRISITSYGGSKKIPWCGCWGSGCI